MSFVVNIKRSNKGAITVTPTLAPLDGAARLGVRDAVHMREMERMCKPGNTPALDAPGKMVPVKPDWLGVRTLISLPRFYRIEQTQQTSGGNARPTARLYPPLPGSKRPPGF